jgi:hypothetical protein
MNLSAKPISPLLRSLAAGTLLMWVAAQVFCTGHCNMGLGHDDAGQASCHGVAPANVDHHDEESPRPAHHDSEPTFACIVLKSALTSGSVPALVHPELSLLYALPPFGLALDATVTASAVSFSRQGRRLDWVFTPEVSLGPAFRSLAPPLSRLS